MVKKEEYILNILISCNMKNTTVYNIVIVSAPEMDGNIAYYFDMEGVMRIMKNNMQTKDSNVLKFIQTHSPLNEDLIKPFIGIAKSKFKMKLQIDNIPADLSFESFWVVYNYKKGKADAETEWNKLADFDKVKVFKALPKYNHYLQTHRNQDKVWASRYLKKKRYLDDE